VYKRTDKSRIQIVEWTRTNLLFAASCNLIAFKCAIAHSLTSTTGIEILGSPGYFPFIIFVIRSPDENPAPTNAGPKINPGFIVTISSFSDSERFF
jgi:hypothetical protein